jgi:hypothetical protein
MDLGGADEGLCGRKLHHFEGLNELNPMVPFSPFNCISLVSYRRRVLRLALPEKRQRTHGGGEFFGYRDPARLLRESLKKQFSTQISSFVPELFYRKMGPCVTAFQPVFMIDFFDFLTRLEGEEIAFGGSGLAYWGTLMVPFKSPGAGEQNGTFGSSEFLLEPFL